MRLRLNHRYRFLRPMTSDRRRPPRPNRRRPDCGSTAHPADYTPQRPSLGAQRRQGLDRRVDRVVLHITNWLVQFVAREGETGRAREMRERPLDAGMFVIFSVLLFGRVWPTTAARL